MTKLTTKSSFTHIFQGARALSAFRRQKLLNAVRQRLPDVTSINAQFVHFVELSHAFSASERQTLEALLRYPGEPEPTPEPASGVTGRSSLEVLVTPRMGTRSPWASKATDIAHNCAVPGVRSIERAVQWSIGGLDAPSVGKIADLLHDRMTQSLHLVDAHAVDLFSHAQARPGDSIPLAAQGEAALAHANVNLGLALSEAEISYLSSSYEALGRDPTDAELMMFAQANSEHCRHKIFNAVWDVDGHREPMSLFDMIRNTYATSPGAAAGRILSAYSDNAAVIDGSDGHWFGPDEQGAYGYQEGRSAILIKVETHNHPTAISPFSGAATGSGGEIRDEGATGRGSKAKAGLVGFSVSNLRIPHFSQPWELATPEHPIAQPPGHLASALEIMLEGPIGAASFNNEFGRPAVLGYFRTYEHQLPHENFVRGYHKPIMLAGGLGALRPEHAHKQPLPPGSKLIVLGGPAMLIGLGGGAASSMASGQGEEALDFASVQRENAEMQRRCQEVIDSCTRLGNDNPILSVHDVGAGGLSNALPELVDGSERGARIDLRKIPSAEPGLSPMEIWSNEAQERYVLAIAPMDIERFSTICDRERCPFAVVGEATQRRDLTIDDDLFGQRPVDIPLDMMLGKMPALHRHGTRTTASPTDCDLNEISLSNAVARVLQLPAVADKSFLITIGDRTVGGMIARDQMVGPWQVPVADCAVTLNGYTGFSGEAMSIGERSPLAVHNAPASGRMAVAEALTNLAAAYVPDLSRVVLSANWMAACGDASEDAALFDTVRAVGMELCPALGIAIPVGKDSLSMQANWNEDGDGESSRHSVRSPVSLIVSAFAPVQDVRRSLTPQLDTSSIDSTLLFIDVSGGKNRMGGSALAQVFRRHGGDTPDVDSALVLKGFLNAIQTLNGAGHLLAYHDRSDGGLFTTLCEIAFASHCGLDISLDPVAGPSADNNGLLRALFNEELGAVIQVPRDALKTVMDTFDEVPGLRGHVHPIAKCTTQNAIIVRSGSTTVFEATRTELHLSWSETSYRMIRERDNPACADEARAVSAAVDDPGLVPDIRFALRPTSSAPAPERPRVAILREQGVNGHLEMAAAFEHAGFSCYDVHMTDIINAKVTLDGFSGLVACGGFSYGDVLGAGGGWANSIRFNDRARAAFEGYFARSDTFTLGVCNGCQMLAHLTDIIPGTDGWPTFIRNRSEQFEARLVMCEIPPSPSIFFQGMEGSRLPVAIAHGEGRAQFDDSQGDLNSDAICMRFVDRNYAPTTTYPLNPNGSVDGITGLTNTNGQVTIMMPHPERTFRTVQYSWHPAAWKDDSPWMQMFWNARHWVG